MIGVSMRVTPAGNGLTVRLVRHSHRKRGETDRPRLRSTAPALDPTAYDELVAKWTPLAPAVVRSLEEAGNQLLTFYEFPRAMWKSIRTTNALENLNREFRRRTKTQASFSSEESAPSVPTSLRHFAP